MPKVSNPNKKTLSYEEYCSKQCYTFPYGPRKANYRKLWENYLEDEGEGQPMDFLLPGYEAGLTQNVPPLMGSYDSIPPWVADIEHDVEVEYEDPYRPACHPKNYGGKSAFLYDPRQTGCQLCQFEIECVEAAQKDDGPLTIKSPSPGARKGEPMTVHKNPVGGNAGAALVRLLDAGR